MGNTCGCVDPAEKDGEVKVENKVDVEKFIKFSLVFNFPFVFVVYSM